MDFSQIFNNLKAKRPQVHCITNAVTISACANIVLACSASPIMAHAAEEVEEIAKNSDALVLNTGTPSPDSFAAMQLAAKAANRAGVPVVLDPVGMGASDFRKKGLSALLSAASVSLIRCNASELCALLKRDGAARGVDGNKQALSFETVQALAKIAARQYHAVIAVTGKLDFVTDGTKSAVLSGGAEILTRVTGSGCMTTALCGAFLGTEKDAYAAACAACALMKVCGEAAAQKAAGTGSCFTALLDEVSLITPYQLQERTQIETI